MQIHFTSRLEHIRYLSFFLILLLHGTLSYAQDDLETLFLTWKDDPTSSMVVNWHTLPDQAMDSLYYRLAGESEWNGAEPHRKPFPYSDRIIYHVSLENLQSDSRYEFQVGRSGEVLWFETMPDDVEEQSLVFAVGGDTFDRNHENRQMWMERMNRVVMGYDPSFIVWGGDLAYAEGEEEDVWRWYGWLEAVKNTLIREDGKVVPIIVALGNHEVTKSYFGWGDDYVGTDSQREESSPYFYSLFEFPGQPGYNVLDFSDYMSLIILDTDHTNPVDGPQAQWLENILKDRKERDHVFPVYHIPAYPSRTDNYLDKRASKRIRDHWTPLFDEYQVPVVFEHHDHVYKRTPPIKNEALDPEGTIYLGDGGWGTKVRVPKAVDTVWYLEKTHKGRYALLVSLYKEQRHFMAVDEYGETFDEFPLIFDRPKTRSVTNAVLLPEGGIYLSAEFAQTEGSVFVDSDHDGYTGGGFAYFGGHGNTGQIRWNVPVKSSGKYRLRFRYSSPAENPGTHLTINGKSPDQNPVFQNTGSPSSWLFSENVDVQLEEGNNVVEFSWDEPGDLRIDGFEVYPE